MTLGRVYNHEMLFFSQCFSHWRGLSNSNPLVLDGTWMAGTRVSSEHWWLITEWWSLFTGVWWLITEWWSLLTGIWWLLRGFTDFAGSAVVHLAGAVLSLPGCVILGARWHLCAGSILNMCELLKLITWIFPTRTDRWTKTGGIPGHSIPFVCLGFLILDFGFLAFNGGSQGSISNAGDGEAFSRAVVNTQVITDLERSNHQLNSVFLWPNTTKYH